MGFIGAAEIIVGLLLMVTFSCVLKYSDDTFTTFWDGLWYCFAVVTTIGFGDLAATSAVGRIVTVILGMYGIIMVALITSFIVNFYGEMKKVDAAQDAPRIPLPVIKTGRNVQWKKQNEHAAGKLMLFVG